MMTYTFIALVTLFTTSDASLLPPPVPAYRNLTADPVSVGHAVRNLQTTVDFYNGTLGLVLLEQTEWRNDSAYGQLTATTGASYRQAILAIPNQHWTLTLTEYQGLERAEVKQREQDPADPGLTLTVKNSTTINNVLSGINATTVNGEPVPAGGAAGTTSTVWVYDPDGYMVELVQRSNASDYFTVPEPTVTDGPGMTYVIRGQLDLTMENYTQALTFYHDILDFDIAPGFEPLIGPDEYQQVGFIGSVFNISSNTSWAAVTGNCDPVTRCEWYEYDDPDRVALIYPVQDIGVGLTYYAVQNLDAILNEVIAANLTIVTEGGSPVVVNGMRSILIRDPAGYLVMLEEEPATISL
ncbi:hypothetical protein K491DRAFT_681826 [Lophiostoma macrostomum CBS 122681]|uniref:VOC domain-containing protein n=1 Tax=Lophiostoma macrostomum CBS 122681 TaxID=1314788 RepID=A0A6A6SZ74_9PLEO|nr:hypothetical protein K491DRAFT_681826 [Lophiostoma macrostomum CBS 122681]